MVPLTSPVLVEAFMAVERPHLLNPLNLDVESLNLDDGGMGEGGLIL